MIEFTNYLPIKPTYNSNVVSGRVVTFSLGTCFQSQRALWLNNRLVFVEDLSHKNQVSLLTL